MAKHLTSEELLRSLISFATVSAYSNKELIAFVQDYLAEFGIICNIAPNEDGTKADLIATIGPMAPGGIVLSGHTDVVPVEGQDWHSDPFEMIEKDGKLYGRGACDMKGFIAVALALVPEFLARDLKVPLHLVFSYDEEVGCLGARPLLDRFVKDLPRPLMCIVGEPTSMQVITGHKGKRSFIANVRGLESHSALAPKGVNAVEYAAELVTYLKNMARRIERDGPFDELYEVTHTTVHTGIIKGGVQLNIVPKTCRVEFEFRYLAIDDPDALEAEIRTYASETLEPLMHAVDPNTGIDIECYNDMPGLELDVDEEVVTFVKALAGRNDHAKVAFGTEAGLFHTRVGIPTVVCGPGDIAVAHKPNEYISLDQIARAETFMGRLADEVSGK